MKIQLLLASLFTIVSSLSVAQLGGIYTVGQPGNDFPDIADAMEAIQAQGTNAPVTFIVSDGQYGVINLSDFQPLSGDSLVIRSVSGHAGNVIFSGGDFSRCDRVTLSGLRFETALNAPGSVLTINACNLFRLNKCRVEDLSQTSVIDQNSLRIYHTFDTTYFTRVFVDSSYISGPDGANPVYYRFTLVEKGSSGRTYYHADTILGGWNFWSSYYREFSDCYIRLDEGADEAGNVRFDRCSIFFEGDYKLRAGTIGSSYIHSPDPYMIYISADSVKSTICDAGIQTDYLSNSYYGGNTFLKKFGTSFGTGSFIGNTFLGNTYFGMDYHLIVNNFFADTATLTGAIYHNNFGHLSLATIYGENHIQQNNFARFDGYYPSTYMLGNNFMAHDDISFSIACFDPQARFYDPEYVSTTDLHIGNPALSGLGIPVTFYAAQDFDGETRSSRPTIGADEICLSLPLRDTVFLECGTDFPLKSCNMPGMQWKPDVLISGAPGSQSVLVDAPKLVWLENGQGDHIDSMLLFPLPVMGSGQRTFEVECGLPRQYAAHVPYGATFAWEPASAVSDPVSRIVWIAPDTNMQVIAVVDAGACGITRDTLNFIVDPNPVAYVLWDSTTCLEFFFHGYYRCVDSVLWDFGDGTSSTDPLLTSHTYPHHGSYSLTLTGWNDGISSTSTFPVNTGCTGIDGQEISGFMIYPNPAGDELYIFSPGTYPLGYEIFDRSGRLLRRSWLSEGEAIDVSGLNTGLYFLTAGEARKMFLKK